MAYVTNEQLEGKTFEERLNLLSEREREYFNKMRVNYGVLYLKDKPGVGKTAKYENIARILDYQYMDIRLTTKDETDVGVFPSITEVKITKDGNVIYDSNSDEEFKIVKVLDYVVPKWALIANSRPTIVVFEELNRASLPVRNAALQILLERRIDVVFKFNENVHFAATGNLGDEDGTDVEEFDSALNNRLIHEIYDLSFDEWDEDFAKDNIHPTIMSFLRANPDYMYRKVSDSDNTEADKYATPRSWDMFSRYLIVNSNTSKEDIIVNKKIDLNWVYEKVSNEAHKYVGISNASKFKKYLDSMISISIQDILNNFQNRIDDFEKIPDDHLTELSHQLLSYNLKTLNNKQLNNLIEFLKILKEELRFSFLQQIIDKVDDVRRGSQLNDYPFKEILLSQKELIKKISAFSKAIV